jgi:type IV pilus assembly protein PilV
VQCNKQAFTLIEALVSVAMMAIGFAGVYALVSTSNRILSDSISREKLNFQASEIIESLHADQANILEYNGKDLGKCASLKTKKGKEDQLTSLKAWCQKLQGEIGNKRNQDRRLIRVVKKKVGQKFVYVVSIDLSGKNNKKTVFMKRVFNAE